MYMLMCHVGMQGSRRKKDDGVNSPKWISGTEVKSTVNNDSRDQGVMTSSGGEFPKAMLAYRQSGHQFGVVLNQAFDKLFDLIRKHLPPNAKVILYDLGAGDFAALYCLTIDGVVAVAGIEAELHRFLEMLDKTGLYSYGIYKDIYKDIVMCSGDLGRKPRENTSRIRRYHEDGISPIEEES